MRIEFALLGVSLQLVGCTTEAVRSDVTVQCNEAKAAPVEVSRELSPRQKTILCEFAIKEAPTIWRAIQEIQGEIEHVDANLSRLKSDLVDFNRDPERDPDYIAIGQRRKEMQTSLNKMWGNLENAYFAYMKFRATPGKKEYSEVMNKALEAGIHEAEMSEKRFNKMSAEK